MKLKNNSPQHDDFTPILFTLHNNLETETFVRLNITY